MTSECLWRAKTRLGRRRRGRKEETRKGRRRERKEETRKEGGDEERKEETRKEGGDEKGRRRRGKEGGGDEEMKKEETRKKEGDEKGRRRYCCLEVSVLVMNMDEARKTSSTGRSSQTPNNLMLCVLLFHTSHSYTLFASDPGAISLGSALHDGCTSGSEPVRIRTWSQD
uniref:Uncharacterized protein n=1 Tax=Knipowitschia caucasica TaxID=637954 RepID=A0AAV2KSD9_KNICA